MAKKIFPETLFLVQVLLVVIFGVGQAWHMLTVSAMGVNIVFFGANLVFVSFNLVLALAAVKIDRTRIGSQVVLVYALMVAANLANMIIAVVVGGVVWTTVDTYCSIVIGLLATTLLAFRPYEQPTTKAYLAAIFKGTTQLALGTTVFLSGAEGVSWMIIIVGHLSIGIRLVQVALSIRTSGINPNTKALLISEGISEATWIATTIVWVWALLS